MKRLHSLINQLFLVAKMMLSSLTASLLWPFLTTATSVAAQQSPPPIVLAALGTTGAAGAMLMFIADLILYYPTKDASRRTAASYFKCIDPGAEVEHLLYSSMSDVSEWRLMFGGVPAL